MILEFQPREIQLAPAATFWTDTIRCPRMGVMLHYDASSSDAGALSWLQHPDVNAGYELVVLDDGSWGRLAPSGARVWHAGKTRSSDPERLPYPNNEANSAFHSIAILNSGREDVTSRQLLTVAWLTHRIFESHGWNPSEGWRVVGHSSEAWPRGRKADPEGANSRNPILSPDDVRSLLPLIA